MSSVILADLGLEVCLGRFSSDIFNLKKIKYVYFSFLFSGTSRPYTSGTHVNKSTNIVSLVNLVDYKTMSSSKFVEKRKHAYKKVFDSFDADGSGQIDKAEVCEAMGIGPY